MNTQKYEEGRGAFKDGLGEDACPYPIVLGGTLEAYRYWWLMGYYQGRIESRAPNLFRKSTDRESANV